MFWSHPFGDKILRYLCYPLVDGRNIYFWVFYSFSKMRFIQIQLLILLILSKTWSLTLACDFVLWPWWDRFSCSFELVVEHGWHPLGASMNKLFLTNIINLKKLFPETHMRTHSTSQYFIKKRQIMKYHVQKKLRKHNHVTPNET